MKNAGYEEIEHTADLALKVWGEDFHALLSQSAIGLYDLMSLEFDPNIKSTAQFILPFSERENILVDFLSELLFLAEDKNAFLQNFTFKVSDECFCVTAKRYEINRIRRNVKAVTFHDLKIIETEQGIETIITFDV